MSWTSILKKMTMALTGLCLFVFVIVHLSGNLLLFAGPEAIDAYTAKLHSLGALLIFAEVGLVVLFLVHLFSGLRVTLDNYQARRFGYAVKTRAGGATNASRTMIWGGIILAVFVVTHVKMFKYGDWNQDQGGLGDLVFHTFHNPWMVGWYEIALVALGLHLSHGFASALQTLGLVKPSWRTNLGRTGWVLGWLIAAGFMVLPIYAALQPDILKN